MKILWLTNVPLPEASKLLKVTTSMSGGWLFRTAVDISSLDNIDLYIAFPCVGVKKTTLLRGEKIRYLAFPPIRNKKVEEMLNNRDFECLIDEVEPDLVHIWGTEYCQTLVMINECNRRGIKSVISIQGIISIIAQSYLNGIPRDVINKRTFRDLIKKDNLRDRQKKFERRGAAEIEAIIRSNLIIGRTTWDKACVQSYNQDIKYRKCYETMRSIFYEKEWSVERCERFSIFVSQGSYPIKGLHFMLMAMPLILRKFPEAKLYVSGRDIVSEKGLYGRLKQTSYARYITELITRNGLEKKVIFLGVLSEEDMCKRYLLSHVFVCPSSIENSPNSVGEAMLLGVPCVASFVGGIPDMICDGKEGYLYQYDSPQLLSHYVCEIFENDETAVSISQAARKKAKVTHDPVENLRALMDIYTETKTIYGSCDRDAKIGE